MAKQTTINDVTLVGRTAGEVLRANFPGVSVDRLLTRPRDAMEVCRRTNIRLERQLQHEDILNALLNARKRGDLSQK